MFEKFSFNQKKNGETISIDDLILDQIPNHVAIIMDGNGRWAKKRGLPRMAGHREGMKTVKKIVHVANKIGVKALTLYAFSTENWKRPSTEVNYLMKLPEEFLGSFLPDLKSANVKVQTIGNINDLPPHTLRAVQKAINDTKDNDGLVLNFALNYGSRDEIIQATLHMYNDIEDGKVDIKKLDEAMFSSYLMTHEMDDPDLLIRTSGEQRFLSYPVKQVSS